VRTLAEWRKSLPLLEAQEDLYTHVALKNTLSVLVIFFWLHITPTFFPCTASINQYVLSLHLKGTCLSKILG
jgi:hypothetical protein